MFTNGGYLYTFDLKSQKAKKLTVYLPGDRDLARPHWANVARFVTDFDISPEGNRAVLTARGDIFTVPAKEGSIRNLTQTPGIREKYAAWSPDGKWIAYLSDRSGEDEIYITPQDGMGKETRITTDGKMFRMPPVWSPDSKKLLFADKDLRLFYVDIEQKTPVLIDQGKYFDITEYVWSPDSKWVAYAKQEENTNSTINLYSLADKKITPVTTSFTSSATPAFDPGGKYLFFLSQRDYNEVLGVYDFEFSNPKATRVYVVTLRADLPSPFAPQSDEAGKKPDESADKKPDESADKDQAKPGEKDKKEAEDVAKNFRIDLAGIENRVVAVPMPPANIGELQAGKNGVYYSTAPVSGLSGPLPGEHPAIHVYDLKERKDEVLLAGATSFTLSFDGSKLLYAGSPGGDAGGEDGRTPQPDLRDHRRQALRLAPQGGRRRAESLFHANADRPARRMETDVQRSVAAGARLFLRSLDERCRLGQGTRSLRPAAARRGGSLRPHLPAGRNGGRAFQLPHLRRRRRLSRPASRQSGPAGRGL